MPTGYLQNGTEVEVIEKTSGGYTIVQHVYYPEDGEGEPHFGKPQLVERVFDSPPTEKLATEVESLREKAADIRREITELNAELIETRGRLAKISKYPDLSRLESFLEGKLSHLVIDDGAMLITPINEAKCDPSDKYDKHLRLLSLMGRHGGTPEWMLNRYSDGSGGHFIAYPCTSYEEARDRLQEVLNDKAGDAIKDYGNNYVLERIVSAAAKYELAIPNGVREKLEEINKRRAESALEEARKKFEAAQEAMLAAEPTTA